jgi:hypothetical protein
MKTATFLKADKIKKGVHRNLQAFEWYQMMSNFLETIPLTLQGEKAHFAWYLKNLLKEKIYRKFREIKGNEIVRN